MHKLKPTKLTEESIGLPIIAVTHAAGRFLCNPCIFFRKFWIEEKYMFDDFKKFKKY